jgi:hypothetical protein
VNRIGPACVPATVHGAQSAVAELEMVLAGCGFIRWEIPAEGPGSTYVVVITPHIDAVIDPDSDLDDSESEGPELEASAGVRVYAIPDAKITADQRRTLDRADGADLTYDMEESEPAADSPEGAARVVDEWVSRGMWAKRLVYSFNHEPLSYHGNVAPDRPSALVTITMPADVWDEVASDYSSR